MRLTRAGDYGVRVVLDLSRQPEGARVAVREIARRQIVPLPYLGKIVQALARARLLRTYRGAEGGVTLARAPRDITLRQVIEAVEGPIALNRCLIGPGECELQRICVVHPAWIRIQEVLVRELDAVTFEDLAAAPPPHPAGGARRPGPASRPVAPSSGSTPHNP